MNSYVQLLRFTGINLKESSTQPNKRLVSLARLGFEDPLQGTIDHLLMKFQA